MWTQPPLLIRRPEMLTASSIKNNFITDKAAKAFLLLALSYLFLGLMLGIAGGLQYILPSFLKEHLGFQKTRPLHVYLVISWIFTAAQGGIYYYLPRIGNRSLYWEKGAFVHFFLQAAISLVIICCFFLGRFGGREYLEFPPLIGVFIFLSWIPFAINFFLTLRPDYKKAPVYIWSWSTGILFFFITLSECYLWVFDFFRNNIIRDVTVQWKALGSMVGSWNMLVYGTAMYIMEKISGDSKPFRSPLAFAFYFLGLTNLMFNWGHHTYIVPAAPWIKTTAYIISMTELLILGNIIWNWRNTLTNARRNYLSVPFRLLSFGDLWIFLNLILAIAISLPAWNYYSHGTHITVAHAMGATIGINTMLLMASVFYIIQQEKTVLNGSRKKAVNTGIFITNASLLIFWIALLCAGFIKINGKLNNETFNYIMQKSQVWFRLFTYSGILLLVSLSILIGIAITSIYSIVKISEEKGN